MDLSKLNVSNGNGEAVRSLVTVLRAPGGTVITPNSLVNWPTNFVATTGPLLADGTLDPAKTIVFMGHITGSTYVIDSLAPGYTDTYGSAVGDVVVIKPNTWAQDTHVNATTTNKNDIATINTTTFPLRQREGSFDYIASGGVITGDSYAGNRNASMTAIVAYINGYRQTVAAVAARTYTASKDTYVDILYNVSGVATLVYTEVANNAASPPLAANSIRIAIIVTGATNIAAATSINQGSTSIPTLPVVTSRVLRETDSLGNAIYNTNPTAPGAAAENSLTGSGETTTSVTYVGLTTPTVVATKVGRSGAVRISLVAKIYNFTSGQGVFAAVAVSGATTRAADDNFALQTTAVSANRPLQQWGETFLMTGLTPGLTTFTVQYRVDGGTLTREAVRLLVEPV